MKNRSTHLPQKKKIRNNPGSSGCQLRVRRLLLVVLLFAALPVTVVACSLAVALGPSAACRSWTDGPVLSGTTSARYLVSGERERCYVLHVPPSYNPAQPLSLVVVLHGLASNGEMIQEVTRWDEVADREGFIVVYPDGLLYPLRWNANSNMNLNVDDVQFFRDLVAEVSMLVSVDLTRVYVNGFSNGATMSIRLGCQATDVVAAIGLVDPGVLTEETLAGCSLAQHVPGIEFIGTGDTGVGTRGNLDQPHQEFTPLHGLILGVDSNYEALPSHAWGERWAVLNDCEPIAEQFRVGDTVSGLRYGNCEGNGEVIVYTLEGMGHQWPGGEPFPTWLAGAPNNEIDATEKMWAFFRAHSLP